MVCRASCKPPKRREKPRCRCNTEAAEVNQLHARWIAQMFEHLKTWKDQIFNGFESAVITEAVEKCNEIGNCEENPFRALL